MKDKLGNKLDFSRIFKLDQSLSRMNIEDYNQLVSLALNSNLRIRLRQSFSWLSDEVQLGELRRVFEHSSIDIAVVEALIEALESEINKTT